MAVHARYFDVAAAAALLQFYKLTNSHSQISSYVFDVVRASVPKMNLDDVFLEKEAIARSIRNVSV
jgi:regulator of protease activity HflC (stomatin/prohibitin superfamily)